MLKKVGNMNSKELLESAKTYIIFEGILAILFGLILMLWPGLSVATFIVFIGFYGIIHGIILLIMAIFSQKGEPNRGLSVATGALSLLFGIIILNMPVLYAAFNLYVIAAMIGIEGIFLAFHGFTASKDSSGHKIMLTVAGILTLLFSIWVFTNPKEGGILMIFLLSLTLIISGALTIAAGSSIKTK